MGTDRRALIGYVPVPTDSACPDYEPQKISADFAFDVSFDTEVVFDQSLAGDR